MAFTPTDKKPSDPLRSQDWNDHVHETLRLDIAKVNRTGDAIVGDLTINGALTSGGLTVNGALSTVGNVGVGTANPQARLTIQQASTDAAAVAANRPLFVSGNLPNGRDGSGGGIEFRHDNLSAGIGFGFNTIYATGSGTDQELALQSRGASPLLLNPNGSNVGINRGNAVFPLHFPAVLGDKIVLWGEYPTANYGLGIQASTLQIHTDTAGGKVAFGWGGSTNFNETMRIQGDGTLVVQGAITPNWGNSTARGLMFPLNPGGGGGDTAYMRYYPRTGEACTLEIGITNDGDDHIQLMTSGCVGINCVPALPFRLDVNGWVRGGSFQNSDARYKKNIHSLSDALATVRKLRGVRFDWDQEAHPAMNLRDGMELGLIAQEVETVLPELVVADDAGYRALSYVSLIPLLIEAIKEQQAQIETMQAMAARS